MCDCSMKKFGKYEEAADNYVIHICRTAVALSVGLTCWFKTPLDHYIWGCGLLAGEVSVHLVSSAEATLSRAPNPYTAVC